MIHHPCDVPGAEGVLSLLVPRDPSHPWFIAATNAEGVSWRVTPDALELELSPALLVALVQEIGARMVAMVAVARTPAVASMDVDPPAVVGGADVAVVVGG